MKSYASKFAFIGMTSLLLPLFAHAESKSPVSLWQNREPSAPFGQATSIDASAGVAVAVGDVGSSAFNHSADDWFVRAYDTSTGLTLWEDRIDVAGLRDQATAVAVHDGRAFVVGNLQTSTSCAFSFVVRAYGLKTGKLLWDRRYPCESAAAAVAADGGQVFAVGYRPDAANTGLIVGALVALDAQTGATLWEANTASTADPTLFPGAFAGNDAVQLEDDRVFVAGQKTLASGSSASTAMYVKAYDRHKGIQLWEHLIPHSSTGPTNSVPLAISHTWVAVGGATDTQSGNIPWDYKVTMLDKNTGALLWTDNVHRQAGGLSAGLGFGAGKLFAYGWDCDVTVFNCHGNVRAYDPGTGTLQWENRFTGPGGDIVIPIPGPAPFAVNADQIFLGAALLNQAGDEYEWTLRSYDGKDGSLRGESQTYDGGGLGDAIIGLKMRGDRLYASGYIDNPDGGLDFAVRAYKIDPERCDLEAN